MTIAIGFPFRHSVTPPLPGEPHFDTILLASDSRLTSGNSCQSEAEKIIEVKFSNASVLVAYAGTDLSAQRFMEMYAMKAAGTIIGTHRTPADLAEDVIRELRRLLAKDFEGDMAQRMVDHSCHFIIAYFHAKFPYIYRIDLDSMLAAKFPSRFASMGCASTLADFIMTGVDFEELTFNTAPGLAVATIELCKLHDVFCGGAVRLGAVYRDFSPQCEILPSIYLDGLEGVVQSNSVEVHKAYVNRLVKDFWTFIPRSIEPPKSET